MSFLTLSTRPLRAVGVSLFGWLLATGSGWSATTVDSFDAPQPLVAGGATHTRPGAMLGGTRLLAPQAGSRASVAGGVLELGQDAAGSGLAQVIWGGAASLKTGLGGVALDGGGDDAFLFGVTAATQATTLTLQVWTDDTKLSSVDVAVAATGQPAYYRVPFSALTGTANFGSVGAVGLALKLGATANRVQVDFLRTTKTTESEPIARLTDVVLVDRNGDGRAGAGDTLRYFLTVTNPGAVTLTNVQVAAAVPAHTTDVAGSLTASPLARSTAPAAASAPGDAWHVAFDTAYTRTAGEGLLGAAFLGAPAATVTSFGGGMLGGSVGDNAADSATTVDGHQLRVNADGSLAYTPKPGFTGLFSFQYRIANASGASTATAQIAVGTRPAAKADALALVGNIAIQPSSAQGVIHSFGGAGADAGSALQVLKVGKDAATVTTPAGSATPTETAQGGSLVVQADGSFVYNPKAGFTGEDSFYYQVDNGFTQPSVAKVTLTVARRVWFIDSAAATNGDGRFGTPFNSIAGFVTSAGYTAAAAGDVVYLYSGSGYSGLYTLKAGQTLAGQVVALTTLVPVPAYSAGPGTSAAAPAWSTAQITLPASGGVGAVRGLALAGNTRDPHQRDRRGRHHAGRPHAHAHRLRGWDRVDQRHRGRDDHGADVERQHQRGGIPDHRWRVFSDGRLDQCDHAGRLGQCARHQLAHRWHAHAGGPDHGLGRPGYQPEFEYRVDFRLHR
ncbi:MAG: cadherin-like domain-containing protein [Opitutaceae bacterium]|nr:cadherin-like domain-containing protein [Opitutaceae bacterium]